MVPYIKARGRDRHAVCCSPHGLKTHGLVSRQALFSAPLMSEHDLHPTATFAVWANAFSSAELDRIEALGDRLTAEKATLASAAPEGAIRGEIRITQTAWLAPTPETKWIYDRVQGVARSLNGRVYQFDLSGFSENIQYTVYHGEEGGHYDWHVDHGPIRTRRKLSISV